MAHKKIETIINEKIAPHKLNEIGKAQLAETIRKHKYEFLIECIDIGIKQYFRYDENGVLSIESVNEFLNKLAGIAYNRSQSPIDQEIAYIKFKCRKSYSHWDDSRASDIFTRYILGLRNLGWTDNEILNDLQTEVNRICKLSRSWSHWTTIMENWINDLSKMKDEDSIRIEQDGSILPTVIFTNLSPNFQSLCKQINASYEKNLFDCTAVMMRRLLEGLLVLSYQNFRVDDEITAKNGRYTSLDKIIKNAEQNATLALSANTRKDMVLFKDLGNYSAHKIWYNSTQQDIKPHILKYRAIIEELLYKAGLK